MSRKDTNFRKVTKSGDHPTEDVPQRVDVGRPATNRKIQEWREAARKFRYWSQSQEKNDDES